MKGTIFNILEEFICENFGDEAYEELLEKITPELNEKGPFVGPGTYPDSDFFALVGALLEMKGISPEDGVRALGKYAFKKLLDKLPISVNQFENPKSLILGINGVIHMEVKKLYEDAELPFFEFDELSEKVLVMKYFSSRKLYPFVKGLLDGLAVYMNSPFEQEFRKEGSGKDEYGVFTITFS